MSLARGHVRNARGDAATRERGRNVWVVGPLLTLAAAGVVELVDRFLVHVPNPGVVVLVAAAYAAYLGGFRAGLASSLVAVLYSAWTLSQPGAGFRYTPENAVRLAVLLAATPGTALLVGVLRERLVRETLRAAELSAEQRRRSLEEAFGVLFRHNPLPMWVYDLETLRFLAVNRAAVAHYGYSEEEFLRIRITDIHPEEDVPRLLEDVRRPRPEFQQSWVWRHRTKDGRVLHAEVSSHKLEFAGRPGALVVAHDVTDRVRAEEALRALTQELEERVRERTAQLEAANRELEAFSYSVAHDLRAPLRSIDGFSQALLEDYGEQLDETGRDYLRRVRAASQRMGELIDDLLRLSRVARSPMQLQEVDLSALVARIGAELQQRAAGRAVELRVQPGVVARADPKLVAVVLENLLDNAWKFTAPRRQALVEFGVVQTEGGLACFVRDNGVGFDMQYADRLFAPLQRLHKPSEFPGTGIGLATVQRVVARHGGKVWAQAQVDGGATFYFTLPGLEVRGAAETDPAGGGQPG